MEKKATLTDECKKHKRASPRHVHLIKPLRYISGFFPFSNIPLYAPRRPFLQVPDLADSKREGAFDDEIRVTSLSGRVATSIYELFLIALILYCGRSLNNRALTCHLGAKHVGQNRRASNRPDLVKLPPSPCLDPKRSKDLWISAVLWCRGALFIGI